MTIVTKGKVVEKVIQHRYFEIRYVCACGGIILFHNEREQQCPRCSTIYVCKVMIARKEERLL